MSGKGISVVQPASSQFVAPAEFGSLVRSALDGDLVGARAMQYRLLSLMRMNFVESNPIPVKYAMSRLGLLENNLRPPMTPLDPACMSRVDAALVQAGLLGDAGDVVDSVGRAVVGVGS